MIIITRALGGADVDDVPTIPQIGKIFQSRFYNRFISRPCKI